MEGTSPLHAATFASLRLRRCQANRLQRAAKDRRSKQDALFNPAPTPLPAFSPWRVGQQGMRQRS